jgi:hypothetical protein
MNKLILASLSFTLAACSTAPKKEAPPEAAKVSIMAFNVENLFDDEDAVEKNDEPYLSPEEKSKPAFVNRCRTRNSGGYMYECLEKDWSNLILQRKLKRLAAVVAQVNHGYGPDILILEEVENAGILKRWRDEFLSKMNYQTLVLIEGPDERGIDTAVMSRLPQTEEAKLHLIDFISEDIKPEDVRPTRGILETRLKLPNGDKLAVFAVHFPSQGAPTQYRREAMKALMEVTSKVPKDTKVIVGGDFNITAKEDWKYKYFREIAGKDFAISHELGCHDCAGSIYYNRDKTWSFFDVIMFSKNMVNGEDAWQVDPDSIQLMNKSVYQTNRYGTPARFGSGKASVGVSDHWPMYAEIKLRPSIEGVNQ